MSSFSSAQFSEDLLTGLLYLRDLFRYCHPCGLEIHSLVSMRDHIPRFRHVVPTQIVIFLFDLRGQKPCIFSYLRQIETTYVVVDPILYEVFGIVPEFFYGVFYVFAIFYYVFMRFASLPINLHALCHYHVQEFTVDRFRCHHVYLRTYRFAKIPEESR